MNRPRAAFHVTLHARPPGSWPQLVLFLDGRSTPTLEIPPHRLDVPFPLSFEVACRQLSAWPRLFIEPDGSLVWVSDRNDCDPWQIDGTLYDRHDRLLYVELKGNGPPAAIEQILAACGCEPAACVVQVARHAVVVEVAEFYRLLTDPLR